MSLKNQVVSKWQVVEDGLHGITKADYGQSPVDQFQAKQRGTRGIRSVEPAVTAELCARRITLRLFLPASAKFVDERKAKERRSTPLETHCGNEALWKSPGTNATRIVGARGMKSQRQGRS